MTEYDAQIDADEEQATARHLPGGLDYWAVRLVYAIVAGFVINVLTGIYVLGNVVAVSLFVLSTVIVVAMRHYAAGADLNP